MCYIIREHFSMWFAGLPCGLCFLFFNGHWFISSIYIICASLGCSRILVTVCSGTVFMKYDKQFQQLKSKFM